MTEPHWQNVNYEPIDYQGVSYYAAPKEKKKLEQPGRGRSRDPRDLRQARHPARRAEAARRTSPSMRCSTRCRWRRRSAASWRSSASSSARSRRRCRSIPSWCKQYLGSVVPHTDNFFAALNSAVFSDGSFVYMPKGVRCPMELSTYFRINAKDTGQFERTLIICRRGRDGQLSRRLHGAEARREPAARRGRRARRARRTRPSSTRPSRTGIPATRTARAASTTSSPSAASARAIARRSPGRRSRPARRSPGSIRAASCRATTRSASSTRSRSPTTSSRPTPAPR